MGEDLSVIDEDQNWVSAVQSLVDETRSLPVKGLGGIGKCSSVAGKAQRVDFEAQSLVAKA